MKPLTPRTGQVKEITSLANPIIKDLKALALKKNRDQSGLFIAEGLKLIIDALEQNWRISTLIFAKSGLGNQAVEKVAAQTVAKGGLVIEANNKVITSITRRENPQTVIGVFEQQWHSLSDLKIGNDEIYIALDRVRDPGNLGTIIRTADAVGASGIILMMGNEQQGLPDSLAQSCTKLVRIAQKGRADSLNLSIATAVMLYEMRRNILVLDER